MTLTLVHAAGSVVVDAPEPECRWLTSFLAPAYRVAPGAEDGSVRVRLEAPLTTTPGCRDAERVAFVLDRRPARLAVSEAADRTMCVDPELHVAYAVADSGRHTAVHRGPREDLTRIALMRVVREYAHNALVDAGGVVIHAAAFAGARGAVLLTGPKGVGKTTLLARMLSRPGMSYLANDRVGIPPDQSKALAIPTIVAVRSGTRRLLPAVSERLRGPGRVTALRQPGGDPPDRRSDSWYFSPRQFAGALSCDLIGDAPLAAVVALRPETAPGRVRHASPEEAVALLADSLLGAHAGACISEIFRAAAPGLAVAERLRDGCRRLAGAVPCFTLSAPASLDRATLDGLQSLCA